MVQSNWRLNWGYPEMIQNYTKFLYQVSYSQVF
jgi:hypothetical protein